MSDDLISRKEALERLRLLRKFNPQEVMQVAVDAAEQQINFCGTAFDKEKVIEELKEIKNHSQACRHQCEFASTEYFDYMGAEVAYKTAIAIVEKGGIE